MSAYFVTATGTDIGKTFVTAGLVRHLRRTGQSVSALKPVVSGFDSATAALSDPGVLLRALGTPITPESLDRISPWRFAAPLSPNLAAARERREIDFGALVQLCRDVAATQTGTLLIEGVGGVMVPLDATRMVLDWMVALSLPVLLVTGTYLGTLSHTLTALEVLRLRGLVVRALVINDSGAGEDALKDTTDVLRRFGPGVPVTVLPRMTQGKDCGNDFAALWSLLG